MKLLIGVTNCHKAVYLDILSRKEPPNNSLCADYSRKTWIKDALAHDIDVRFFYGRYDDPPGTALIPRTDEVFLNCDDSYDGLVDKVTAMAAWAYENGYDYFMKVDIDSYVHIENLLSALEKDWGGWDYIGRGWGLGYILTRRVMKVVADTKQRLSWAEDSHVLRTLFSWGWRTPSNRVKLYGDGRFIFFPNMIDSDLPLYDKTFVVVNPMMPETMLILDETKSLQTIMPFPFVKEDLWVAGDDRVQHSKVHNAFCIKGEKFPIIFNDWVKLTPHERQPYLDWTEIINACAETDQVKAGPTFEQWMGPIKDRKIIQNWARKVVCDANCRIQQASILFKSNLGGV